MRRIAVLVAAAAAVSAGASRAWAATGAPELSPEEEAFCTEELEVLERREDLFTKQGLSATEIQRRNDLQLRTLAECRDRFRAQQRRAGEQKDDLEEVARRAGPDSTEKERDRAWKEIRRERLSSKPSSLLTKEEKAELADGMQDELATTHAALDGAHSRDATFMRVVHSAVACYHGDRKAELQDQIASEEALLKLGNGERKRLYGLKSELRLNEDVLARSREANAGRALERCSQPTVAVVAHCLGVRLQSGRAEAMCESEEIQQYIRFVR